MIVPVRTMVYPEGELQRSAAVWPFGAPLGPLLPSGAVTSPARTYSVSVDGERRSLGATARLRPVQAPRRGYAAPGRACVRRVPAPADRVPLIGVRAAAALPHLSAVAD